MAAARPARNAVNQRIHIATTPDGVQLAWARSGRGPTLVKASNWMTHLRDDVGSPVWGHWTQFLSAHFDFVRFDERGCGLSDRHVEDVSSKHWLGDLETVVEAAAITRPMVQLGISQGSAATIQYAIAHPERVSHLILYGGYARGGLVRGGRHAEHYRALMEMVRLGWGNDNALFRQAFTARFVPDGNHQQLDWFNDLCRRTVAPDMAYRIIEARANTDITALLPQVRVPTLVLHCDRDQIAPLSEGRVLASGIPGAEFVQLDSPNHVLLEHEPAWRRFQEAVLEFTGIATGAVEPDSAHAPLTPRERVVMQLLCEGRSNAQIAWALGIAEKTVRNHVSGVYRKLGVRSRAEAIVRAYRPSDPAA